MRALLCKKVVNRSTNKYHVTACVLNTLRQNARELFRSAFGMETGAEIETGRHGLPYNCQDGIYLNIIVS